ncbi:MAG: hypothetical protein PHD02_02090 [Bacilli bacterium]|nr:hypothetical protein [Bacilli bacterium]
MKKRHKLYLKLNLMSVVFIVVSFISVTLAWFAYSGLADVATEVNVKAWYIELSQYEEVVSNDISITFSDIYPGMTPVEEEISIKNKGDSDAQISYDIVSARLLDVDEFTVDDVTTSPYVEDLLSHDYPFHINMTLSKGYALESVGESTFKVSISWPLDSDTDELDSYWGMEAYSFEQGEIEQNTIDPEYQIRPSIKVVIRISAEQYLEEEGTSDYAYNLGDNILFDVVSNSRCYEVSSTCLSTYVIDADSKLSDSYVSLLPDVSGSYSSGVFANYDSILSSLTSTWMVDYQSLTVEDVLNIISNNITSSLLVRSGLSDMIIGNLKYAGRMTTELNLAKSYSGYYLFSLEDYSFLNRSSCYWTNSTYDGTSSFAIMNNTTDLKLYNELNTTSCEVIPVIHALKANLY